MSEERILAAQGGILVELNQGQRFKVGEDGHLRFRIRNLTERSGLLSMRLNVERVDLHNTLRKVKLLPEQVSEVRFSLSTPHAGEKIVEQLEIRFKFQGESRRRLVLPDDTIFFHVAAKEEQAGSIDLSGVTFDFRDHVGDVNVHKLIERQDSGLSDRPDDDWKPLRLVPRPADGDIEVQPPRAQGVRDIVLVERNPRGHERRIFLFARDRLRFGVRWEYDGEKNPLVIRRLPCDSKERDARNYELNCGISRYHGQIALAGDMVCIEDHSSYGLLLDRRKVPKDESRPLPVSFRLQVPEEYPALKFKGRLFYPEEPGSKLALGEPREANLAESWEVGAELPLPVDCVRLEREGNVEEHSYFQVFRSLAIGSDRRGVPLRLKSPGISPFHAVIVPYRGEWFITAHPDSLGEGLTVVNGRKVRPERYLSIAPGKSIVLGDREFQIRAVEREDMERL